MAVRVSESIWTMAECKTCAIPGRHAARMPRDTLPGGLPVDRSVLVHVAAIGLWLSDNQAGSSPAIAVPA